MEDRLNCVVVSMVRHGTVWVGRAKSLAVRVADMNLTRSLGRRVEPSSVTAVLAIGDLLAIGIFVVAGELSHGYDLIAHVGRAAGTMAPFVIGWVLVSVAGQLYTREAISDPRRAVLWTMLAWAVAVGIAQALRATSVFHGEFAPTFALVSFGVGGVLLVTWRAAASHFT